MGQKQIEYVPDWQKSPSYRRDEATNKKFETMLERNEAAEIPEG